MIRRIKEQLEPIRTVLGNARKVSHLVPTGDVIDSVIAVLVPLEDLTDLLSGEKRVTCFAIKPLLKHIFENILSDKEEDTTLTCQLKAKIKQDLESRYIQPNISDVCSFLDPRFKGQFNPTEVVKVVKEEMELLVTEDQDDLDDDTDLSANCEPPPKRGKFSQIFGKSLVGTVEATLSASEKVEQEVNMYIQLPVADIDKCPLQWWKSESNHLPTISKVARKYLCACATSVPSERTFSTGGNIVTKRRSCLKPDKVNQLVFLAKNLQ